MWHDQHAHARQFFLGQTVMAQNLRPGPKWVPGVVVERVGPLSYLVQVRNGAFWKRHVDLLRQGSDSVVPGAPPPSTMEIDPGIPAASGDRVVPSEEVCPDTAIPERSSTEATPPVDASVSGEEETLRQRAMPETSSNQDPTPRRYPQRVRKTPNRYM